MDHLTYSSDQLKSFRSTDLRIPHALRKILLKSQIWAPRGVSLHSSASSSSTFQTESTIAFSTSSLQNQSSDKHSKSTELSHDSPSTQLSGLHIATWNAHSITDKFACVTQTIQENKLDISAITRHGIGPLMMFLSMLLQQITPSSTDLVSLPALPLCEQRTHGGSIAVYYRSCLHPSIIRCDIDITTFDRHYYFRSTLSHLSLIAWSDNRPFYLPPWILSHYVAILPHLLRAKLMSGISATSCRSLKTFLNSQYCKRHSINDL